jgi:hypothetical protein
MKPHRVILTVELETDIPVKDLKLAVKGLFECVPAGDLTGILEVVQVQANVIKKERK